MTRKERLELQAEQVRNEARELREAFHAAYTYRDSWRVLLRDLWHQFWRDLTRQHRHYRSGPRLSRAAVRNSKRGR